MSATMHDDEINVSDDVVVRLIAAQFPRWAHVPVRRLVSRGTVNAIFRIGDDVTARFPLRNADPTVMRGVLHREAVAARQFAEHCPVAAPWPIVVGDPGLGYPLPWSAQSWVDGTTAMDEDVSTSYDFARDLAALLARLRAVDTGGGCFQGGGRGGDISRHDEWVQTCFAHCEGLVHVPTLRELWREFVALPRESPDVMTHSDLIAGNVLVSNGRLGGVLDTGGFAPADPALDVIVGWHLLDDARRATFRAELHCDDLEWERSKAWAFEQSIGLVWYYKKSHPAVSEMGRRTLQRIVAAPRS